MLGIDRINDLRDCIETVLLEGVEGDLFEAGVWRGGGVILMRAMLAAYSDEERIVWAADSFRGHPPPSAKHDIGFDFHRQPSFRASLESVRGNVRRYGLSEDRIRYVDGWFEDTLSALEVHRIGVLQIGVDLFTATTTALGALYPRVSSGGFVLVDGYRSEELVRRAVDAFRARARYPRTADERSARPRALAPIMNILGINAYHGDASAALVIDGELVAAVEEERFTRVKHDTSFPHRLDPLLPRDERDSEPGDLDHFALSRNPRANLGRRVIHALKDRAGRKVATKRASNLRKILRAKTTLADGLGVPVSAL